MFSSVDDVSMTFARWLTKIKKCLPFAIAPAIPVKATVATNTPKISKIVTESRWPFNLDVKFPSASIHDDITTAVIPTSLKNRNSTFNVKSGVNGRLQTSYIFIILWRGLRGLTRATPLSNRKKNFRHSSGRLLEKNSRREVPIFPPLLNDATVSLSLTGKCPSSFACVATSSVIRPRPIMPNQNLRQFINRVSWGFAVYLFVEFTARGMLQIENFECAMWRIWFLSYVIK